MYQPPAKKRSTTVEHTAKEVMKIVIRARKAMTRLALFTNIAGAPAMKTAQV